MKRPNPSLTAYAKALAKELASGKSFPGPDPGLRQRLREADIRDPNADLKHAAAKDAIRLSDAAALEHEDAQREWEKTRYVEIKKDSR